MYSLFIVVFIVVSPPAPPTPTNVTAEVKNASTVRVTWQWTSSGSAPNCFNTTRVTYHSEGGDESSLKLSNPAATAATLTDLQCNISYTIIVVATAGEHKTEGVAPFSTLQGNHIILMFTTCMEVCNVYVINYYRSMEPLSNYAVSYLSAFNMGGSLPHTAISHPLQGDMWVLC